MLAALSIGSCGGKIDLTLRHCDVNRVTHNLSQGREVLRLVSTTTTALVSEPPSRNSFRVLVELYPCEFWPESTDHQLLLSTDFQVLTVLGRAVTPERQLHIAVPSTLPIETASPRRNGQPMRRCISAMVEVAGYGYTYNIVYHVGT